MNPDTNTPPPSESRAPLPELVSPAYLLRIVETAMDAIISIDHHQNILLFNAAACAMFGYTAEETLGKPISFLLPPRYRGAHLSQVEHFGATRHTRREMGKLGKLYGCRSNGEEFPIEAAISLVETGQGRVYTVIVRDITERVRSEEALRSAHEELTQHIAEVERLHEELRVQALHDSLTGLYNRRFLVDLLPRELARADRSGEQVSVIIADVDHFKRFNDEHGHEAGDAILVAIAALLKDCVRASDFVCRLGGEEFIVVMPGAPQEMARGRAEEIRGRCAELVIRHRDEDLRAAMSFGVASFPEHGGDIDQLMRAADKAMYLSKRLGRNRVTYAGEIAGPSSG